MNWLLVAAYLFMVAMTTMKPGVLRGLVWGVALVLAYYAGLYAKGGR
jgi:hypothetical protein